MSPGRLYGADLSAPLMLFTGGVGLLASVLLIVRTALHPAERSPGRRAIIHWLPIATTSCVCVLFGSAEMGLAVAFGSTVACMSVVPGVLILACAHDGLPEPCGRLWSMLPVTTALAFVLGFQERLGVFEATVMAAQGLLVLSLWISQPASDAPAGRPPASPAQRTQTAAQLVLGLGLTALAAWLATRGAQQLVARDLRYSPGLIGSAILGAALAVPMIATCMPVARGSGMAAVLSTQAAIVFLNLCGLLPALILLQKLACSQGISLAGDSSAATRAVADLLYPRLTWRIDALAAMILSLLLMPASSEQPRLSRPSAAVLIVVYCLYLLALVRADLRG